MAKSNKPLTREALVSMQVIDAQGNLVGKVKDVAFQVGKTGVVLAVESVSGEITHVEWESVQAASDFILLKGAEQSTMQEQTTQTAPMESKPVDTTPLCPTCGKPLTWIPQYKRWYCYNDKKYV
jgi:sporulation protein YlmC with PRC-barrel domain